jgi:hypothetical protein
MNFLEAVEKMKEGKKVRRPNGYTWEEHFLQLTSYNKSYGVK